MTVYRTQCPHCQHEFSISDAQLALKDGYARCSQCLQIFLATDNLSPATRPLTSPTAVLSDITTHQSPAVSPTTESTPAVPIIDKRDEPQIIPIHPASAIAVATAEPFKSAVPTATHLPDSAEPKLFFDDHIGLDDLPDNATSGVTHPSDFNFDILEDFEKLAVPKTPTNSLDKADLTSPSAGVPAQQKNDTANDEAWLEELLNQEKQKELNASYFDKHQNPTTPAPASDVASLLDDFGVDIAPEKQLSQEAYQEKVNQRLAHSPTPQVAAERTARSGVMTGLWLIGSLLLLLGAAVQYVAYNADAIAKSPAQASTVRGLCDTLHLPCNIPYADPMVVDAKLMSIDAKADKSDVMIMLTNQSNLTQLYPTLKLTLQSNNSPVAQMIATPAQYLDDHAKALNPQQLKPIKLRFDLSRNKFDKVNIEKLY